MTRLELERPSRSLPTPGSVGGPGSIGGIVDFWSEVHPEHPALIFLDDQAEQHVTSYAELRSKAMLLAAHLQQTCRAGDRAVLIFPSGDAFVTAFLGCLYAGVLAVPATEPKPRRPNDRLSAVAVDCTPTAVLCTREVLDRIDIPVVCPQLAGVQWICVDEVVGASSAPPPPAASLPCIESDSIAFLQYTSGSTSDPKGVSVSHANLLHNLETIRVGFGQEHNLTSDPAQLGVFWLPPHHDMGLIGGILTPLYLGGTTVIMAPTTFLKRPLRWLEAISRFRGMISGAPNFAYDLCVQHLGEGSHPSLDLSCWDIAFCGAEPVRAETIDRFSDAFAPYGFRRESFYPCYGMAEATLLVSGNRGRRAPAIKAVDQAALQNHLIVPADPDADSAPARLVGCGEAILDGEILIVDPETRQMVAAEQVGEIWYRSESVAQGYWGREEASKEVFEATLADGHPGRYLRTGDMGFLADGQLFVTGRLKEMLVIRGRNLYPQDLEATAHEVAPGLGGAAAFAVEIDGSEELVFVQELDRQRKGREGEFDLLLSQLRMTLIETYDVRPAAVVLVRPFSLPRTTSGKMQRILCRDLYLRDQLKVIAEWKAPARSASQAPRPASQPTRPAANPQPGPSDAISVDAQSMEAKLSHLADDIEQWLLGWLTAHAGLTPEEITPDRPLAEFGLDSLAAVDLAIEVEEKVGLNLSPIIVWNYPTPRHLARYLAEQIVEDFEPSAMQREGVSCTSAFENMLVEIESLSDAEVQQRLASNHHPSPTLSSGDASGGR